MKKVFATICLLLFVFSFPVIANSFFNPDTVYFKSFSKENKTTTKKRAKFYKVIHYFENDIDDTHYYENETNIFLYNKIYQSRIPYGKWYVGDTLIKDYEYEYEIIDTALESKNRLPVDSSKLIPTNDIDSKNFYNMLSERLLRYLEYPLLARENNIQEKVFVLFCFNDEGYLTELKAYPCINKVFTNEVVAIFAPLINKKIYFGNLKNKSNRFGLPVNFKLN